MNRSRRQDAHTPPVMSIKRQEPLSDSRYQDLLKRASALFASAEVSSVESRLAGIAETSDLMTRHGLTMDDIR